MKITTVSHQRLQNLKPIQELKQSYQ